MFGRRTGWCRRSSVDVLHGLTVALREKPSFNSSLWHPRPCPRQLQHSANFFSACKICSHRMGRGARWSPSQERPNGLTSFRNMPKRTPVEREQPSVRAQSPCQQGPCCRSSSSLSYCLLRALSRLLLMASRKSVVFTKCSFNFTLQGEKRHTTRSFWGVQGFRPMRPNPSQGSLA